jgi:hypothetical protein
VPTRTYTPSMNAKTRQSSPTSWTRGSMARPTRRGASEPPREQQTSQAAAQRSTGSPPGTGAPGGTARPRSPRGRRPPLPARHARQGEIRDVRAREHEHHPTAPNRRKQPADRDRHDLRQRHQRTSVGVPSGLPFEAPRIGVGSSCAAASHAGFSRP